MIIQLLLNAIKNVLSVMLVFKIPPLPENVYGYIETMFEYLETGASILANYTPLPYLLTLFGVLIAVDVAILIYHFVMWIIKKIPMLGIS